MDILTVMFSYFIYPGFLFSACLGLVVLWLDRKLTARIQFRVGPPWYQNFLDIIKLMAFKETLVPSGVSAWAFFLMPLVALSSATLVSTILFTVNFMPDASFLGDIIVLVYLMSIPSICLMLGGFMSKNNLASLGASREMKMVLAYELPFILSLIVPVIKSGYSIKIGGILIAQNLNGAIFFSLSGALSFFAILVCLQAKLGLPPFDAPEAETEITSGPYIEYSGKALGFFKLSKAIMAFAAPIFLITIYFGGVGSNLLSIMKSAGIYLGIVLFMVVFKNTNPRVRIDQAVRFFWRNVTAIALLSVVLAYFGK